MATTTTHDPDLGGAPRLIVCVGAEGAIDHDVVTDARSEQVFMLRPERTVLGTAREADVHLAGTDKQLGEIVHDQFDEYVYVQHSGSVPARINGERVTRHPLRTGDRLELGPWTLMYYREEYADHGRPFGGRQGGEGAIQTPQPLRSEMTPAAEPDEVDLRTEVIQP